MASIRPIPKPNTFIKLKNKISIILLPLKLYDNKSNLMKITPKDINTAFNS